MQILNKINIAPSPRKQRCDQRDWEGPGYLPYRAVRKIANGSFENGPARGLAPVSVERRPPCTRCSVRPALRWDLSRHLASAATSPEGRRAKPGGPRDRPQPRWASRPGRSRQALLPWQRRGAVARWRQAHGGAGLCVALPQSGVSCRAGGRRGHFRVPSAGDRC